MINYLKILATGIVFLMIVSCNNDDNIVGGQDILQNDTSSTTGKLIVSVVDQNGNPVTGIRVSLHATFEDLNTGIWIYEVFNNNQGVSDFGFINIGNYYIFAEEVGSPARTNSPGDVAQVRSQKTTNRTVVVR